MRSTLSDGVDDLRSEASIESRYENETVAISRASTFERFCFEVDAELRSNPILPELIITFLPSFR